MPPFQPNATVPVPAPTAPSATGPVDADVSAARTCSGEIGRDRMSFRVPSFVSATTGLIERTLAMPGCSSSHSDHRVGRLPHAERAREENRRLQLAELAQLRDAGDLPEPVADVERRRHAIGEQIAAVRKDRRHAGANAVALDDRRLPHAHAGDIGDGVQFARREHARLDAQIAGARTLRNGRRGAETHSKEQRWVRDAWPGTVAGFLGFRRGITVRARERMSNRLSMIEIVTADITTLAADAIVNAANGALRGGGGVDGAIHRAAGPQLMTELKLFPGCPTGEAVRTRGYKLRARYVIHAVGPVWHGGGQSEAALLARAYESCVRARAGSGRHQVDRLPCHLDGRYRFPKPDAARIALRSMLAHER